MHTNKTQTAQVLWDKFGQEAWHKCIWTINQRLQQMPLSPAMPEADEIAVVAASACLRAFRLGFKVGTAIGEREAKRTKIIIPSEN